MLSMRERVRTKISSSGVGEGPRRRRAISEAMAAVSVRRTCRMGSFETSAPGRGSTASSVMAGPARGRASPSSPPRSAGAGRRPASEKYGSLAAASKMAFVASRMACRERKLRRSVTVGASPPAMTRRASA